MNKNNETIFTELEKATILEARILWEQLEENPKELLDFCKFAKDLNYIKAKKICPLLSLTNAKPCIELLIEYTKNKDKDLSLEAFNALRKIDGYNAQKYVLSLLEDVNSELCIPVINLLCYYGLGFDIAYIRRLLKSTSEKVIEATLLSLSKLNFKKSARKNLADLLLNCLTHNSVTIRKLSAEQICYLPITSKPLQILLQALQTEADIEVKIYLCKIFGKHQLKDAISTLLNILENETNQNILRKSAVEALANYPQENVAFKIINVMATKIHPELKRTCIQSLGAMPEELIIHISNNSMQSQNANIRIIGYELAGLLALPETEDNFCNWWQQEKDTNVILHIIEIAGQAGFKKAWPQIREALKTDELTSYTAVQSLSSILTKKNLYDFSSILEEEHPNSIYESVLSRLEMWGQNHTLPEEIAISVKSKLKHPYLNIAILACRVSAHIKNKTLSIEMLNLLQESSEIELLKAISKSLLYQHNYSLYELITQFPEYHAKLKLIIKYASSIKAEKQAIIYLAKQASNGLNWATNALISMAQYDLKPLNEILSESTHSYNLALIEAWVLADLSQQLKHPLPIKHLLTLPQKEIRIATLLHPPHLINSNIYASIIDASLFDEELSVRKLATKIISNNFIQVQKEH